jgi:biopolymer transport protein ExbD
MPVERALFRRGRLSLTSLIDVIFLLLLFFMLSSTFARHGEITFLAGAARGGAADGRVIFLRLDGQDLSLNGTRVALQDLAQAVARQADGNAAPQVVVAVTGTATSQELVDVLVPLASLPQAQVTVVN